MMSERSPYVNPVPVPQMDLSQFTTRVLEAGINNENLGNETQRQHLMTLIFNSHVATVEALASFVNSSLDRLAEGTGQSVDSMTSLFTTEISGQRDHIAAATNALQEARGLISALEARIAILERLLASRDSSGTTSMGKTKAAEPPIFSGSENKMHLKDWINQIALVSTIMGYTNDHQKILLALTRLHAPATTYMRSYYDKVEAGQDLGTWVAFTKELNNIYGQRDDKAGAKKELAELWNNKELAKKNFVKFAEQYRTLARLVEYTDEVHIDKLKVVIPQELRNALIMYDVNGDLPEKWEEYLELLMKAFKALHPEKAQGAIFGSTSGSVAKDPNAMEIDEAKKKKAKEANSQERVAKHCKICEAKGQTRKAKSHNTEDCYDKPGNEDKRPNKVASTSQKPTPSSSGTPKAGNKPKSLKARLLQLLESMNDSDDEETPTDGVSINSATAEEVPESISTSQLNISHVDGAKNGFFPGSTGSKNKGKGRAQVDFVDGL